jgi:hypothetical protein
MSKALARTGDGANVISLIERAATDPNFDADKMKALVAMRDHELHRIARHDFNLAFNRVQKKVAPVVADASNDQTHSKYASYPALDAALRPIYSAEGFSISYNTGDSPLPEHIRVFAELSKGSHSRMYQCDIPCDGKGAKGGDVMTKTHAAMSATTYGQRNLLKMIFGIAITKDDDGNRAGKTLYISEAQVAELKMYMESIGALEQKALTFCNVERLEEITQKDLKRLMAALKGWADAQKKQTGADDFPGDRGRTRR